MAGRARLVSERNRYSWQWWELITRVENQVRSRFVSARPTWPIAPSRARRVDRLSYGNNAIQEVPIRVS